MCLESIKHQSVGCGNLEVIVVDNGSDNIPMFAVQEYDFTSLLQEKVPGPGPARNTGIKAAKGEYLFFIDADCLAHEDWVRNGLAAFDKYPDTKIFGGDVQIARENTSEFTPLEAYESVFAYQQEKYIKDLGFSGSGNLATIPSVFDDVGFFPGIEVAEDRAWGRRSLQKGYITRYLADFIIYHPARKSSMELCDKWERHVRHDYEEISGTFMASFKWILRSLLVFLSIFIHGLKIIRSNRIRGFFVKVNAFKVLTKIRLFRVQVMLRLMYDVEYRISGVRWNRN
ncbi:hypothetical protein GCM10017044_20300 [Kordiimonas sediminis]|uniref:Glycosyltransferase 2-like domain-containing protein n=1 Tax=Kordiimonas sediminis TaxID=1735581 RepID=A0A919E8U9_9PROT|nr:hypothetical protein GCM10017044_20300 [Kordiimonas sediminis]